MVVSNPQNIGVRPLPTFRRVGEFKYYFYSSDCMEPRHVHARIGKHEAKFRLDPEVRLSNNKGLTERQVSKAARYIRSHVEELRNEWDDYCVDPSRSR